jgi:hypothetical protein
MNEELTPMGSELLALIVGLGGSGSLSATHLNSNLTVRHGGVIPGVKFLAFDVMPEPPEVNGPAGRVRLTPDIEYLQIGRGCNPPALRAASRTNSIDGGLRDLVLRQPGGRLPRSLQNGSEGERLFGRIALEWSRTEVRRMISRALTELSDLRLPGKRGTGSSILIVVVAGTAGGVGSSIALPVVADIKREADRLGIDPASCTFIGVAILPEALEPTKMRSSNAFDTISDYDYCQKEGVLPC